MNENLPDGFFSLDNSTFLGIMLRFGIDIFFLFILISLVYFRYSKKEKLLFTMYLMGIMVFFICSMLGTVHLDISFAFGLFAVFAILRFRTRNVGIKDMAYIFTGIGISMINSLKVFKFPMLGILIFNIIIILAAFVLEEYLLRNKSDSHVIVFDRLELLKPEKEEKLLREISEITGKDILRIRIKSVDYKRKQAFIEIFYRE